MPDILIVDGSAICGELLVAVLEAQGYSAAWADLAQAQDALKNHAPSLVILEPGPVGSRGWVLLAEMRRAVISGHKAHVVIVSDQAGKADVLRAAQLGVRDYMLKSRFSIPELLTRIRRHLAPTRRSDGIPTASRAEGQKMPVPAPAPSAAHAANAPPPPRGDSPSAVENEDFPSILAKAKELGLDAFSHQQTLDRLESAPVKTLPGVVAELISLVNSPRGTVSDVAQILRRDPVLTARTLRVANSAGFATQRARIATVEDAVKIIGVAGVRNLVINVGVFDAFETDSTGAVGVTHVWQHCLGVAMLMEKFTPDDVSAPPGSAYLVGLCHDLADMVLRQHFKEQYAAADVLAAQSGCRSRVALRAVFGMPYAELVSQLLTRLRLPPIITLPIEEFFERGDLKKSNGAGTVLGRTLRAINVYAHGLLLAPGVNEPITPLTKAECANTFGSGPLPAVDDEAIRGEALATAGVLAGLSAAQTQQMFEPMVPRQPLSVCYCRDEDYAKFDPLEAFLRLGAREVAVSPALAMLQPEALAAADALIVAAPRSAGPEICMRDLGRIRDLVRSKPIPVLYLTMIKELPTMPSAEWLSVRRLPIEIQALGQFLSDAAKSVAKPAAAA